MLFCLSQSPQRKIEGWKAGRMEGRGRRQKAEDRRQEKVRRLEGWRVGGLAKHLHLYTSNLLKRGLAKKLKGEE